MRTVQCTECNETLNLDDFYRTKTTSGHMRVCKSCHKARVALRQLERYNTDAEFRSKKVKMVVTRQFDRYGSDPEFRSKKVTRVVQRGTMRYRDDTKFALRKRMSVAIRQALKSGKSGTKWEDLLGYNVFTLIKHLEDRFVEGMSWENFGEWHIDHVIPQAAFSFDSEHDPHFKECWGIANLQPLWANENISKSDYLPGGSRARSKKNDL